MDETTKAQLKKIDIAMYVLGESDEYENQDSTQVIAMGRAMVGDLLETGQLKPTRDYVRQYCDVIDGPDDIDRIAAEIDEWED